MSAPSPPPVQPLAPRRDNRCFGCGGANPRGMQLTFEQDHEQRRIRGRFRLGPDYQGSGGMAHGGILAVLVDEAMGKLARFHQVRAVTAELRLEYLRPTPVDAEIVVEAEEAGREGRNLLQRAEIRSATGEVLVRAQGRFVILPPPAG
ncbi:MAG: PaaI family thioesterase [Terriglobales bacterium]